MHPLFVPGLAALIERYDLFVVDQWGVLHDGVRPVPGAREALRLLRDARKRVVLLSNSGKRPETSYTRLEALGFERALYDEAVTSGGQLYEALRARDRAPYDALGEKVHIFAWEDDSLLLENTPFRPVASVAEADWVLCAGAERGRVEAYRADLEIARARGLPLLVANPDFVTVRPDGRLQLCPGSIARAFEAMGGTAVWHGKPTRAIYDTVRAVGGEGPALGIGDSLHHDIGGAAGAGMDAWLITFGIHKDELGPDPDPETVARVARDYKVPAPTFYGERFAP